MTTEYGARKKKQDQMQPEWPSEIKFRPTENKDITHAYEYISGINNLITYYNSAKADIQVSNKGTWVQKFQNFEKQQAPKIFEKYYSTKIQVQQNKNMKGNPNQVIQFDLKRNYEEKDDSEFSKANKKHNQFVNSYRQVNKNSVYPQRIRCQITKNQTQAINNFFMLQDNDDLDNQDQNKLNIFDRRHFTMNKILEKVTNSQDKTKERSVSRKKQHLPEIGKTQQVFQKPDDQFQKKKIDEIQQKDHKKLPNQTQAAKQKIINSQKSQKTQEQPQKQRAESLQMLAKQTELQEDNVFNYNSYFQKKYHNQGLRLDLSEKTKSKLEDFENRIKGYCSNIKI